MLSGIRDTVISGPFALAGLLSLAAGLVSFASPCVVPLVPGYLSYLAGLVGSDLGGASAPGPAPAMYLPQNPGQVHSAGGSTAEPGRHPAESSMRARTGAGATTLVEQRVRWRALGAAGLFVLGFSAVFVAESALVLGVYTSLIENQVLLTRIAGAVSIVMGLALMLPAMQREWRPGMRRVARRRLTTAGAVTARRGRLWGAPILGAAFGTGWLACTSPTLAGIIALSTATEWNGSAARGLILVVTYCAGLGIPFLLLAFGFGWAGGALQFLRRHARGIQFGGAIALIGIGIAMLTGLWGYVLAPLQGTVLLL